MILPEAFENRALFRPGEVSEILGLSIRTIQRDMSAGAFGSGGIRRRGRERWITRQGLLHYLDDRFSADDASL